MDMVHLMPAYTQVLDPLDHRGLATCGAAAPGGTLFWLLVVRRRPAAAAAWVGTGVAVVIAWLIYGMPLPLAGLALAHGLAFGLWPIGLIVFAAMLLYNTTVVSGRFAVLRQSVAQLSDDARVQAILIGFCFGAFLEGAAGAGTPVALCGAILIGLGFPPHQAAVMCLIANTSPVAYGALGLPIVTLEKATGLPGERISVMAAHQLPFLSCIVPVWMTAVLCGWRRTLPVAPSGHSTKTR